jgi:hypothetical protein
MFRLYQPQESEMKRIFFIVALLILGGISFSTASTANAMPALKSVGEMADAKGSVQLATGYRHWRKHYWRDHYGHYDNGYYGHHDYKPHHYRHGYYKHHYYPSTINGMAITRVATNTAISGGARRISTARTKPGYP